MLSQGDIADRLGVAQSTVGRWEAGLKEPGLETITRIAELFGVTPEYLAFGAPQAAPEMRTGAETPGLPARKSGASSEQRGA